MATGGAGMLIGGAGQLFSAYQKNKAAGQTKKIAKMNADLVRAESAEEERRLRKEIQKTEGMTKAMSAASGVQMTGSRDLAVSDMERENIAQLNWLKKSGESRAKSVLAGGDIQASQLKSSAFSSAVSGLTSIGKGASKAGWI